MRRPTMRMFVRVDELDPDHAWFSQTLSENDFWNAEADRTIAFWSPSRLFAIIIALVASLVLVTTILAG